MSGILGGFSLQLGDFIFDEASLETPESIGSVGGTQAIAERDFPGGLKSQQTFGWFPVPISWRGLFTGPFATERRSQVAQMAATGAEYQLTYGDKSWLGRIVQFDPRPRHQFLIPYTLTFLPRVDLATVQQGEDDTPEQQLSGQTDGASDLASQSDQGSVATQFSGSGATSYTGAGKVSTAKPLPLPPMPPGEGNTQLYGAS